MQEIRFRYSEDILLDEIKRRRNFIMGFIWAPCTTCGSHYYCICDPTTRTIECEHCFAERRARELTYGETYRENEDLAKA